MSRLTAVGAALAVTASLGAWIGDPPAAPAEVVVLPRPTPAYQLPAFHVADGDQPAPERITTTATATATATVTAFERGHDLAPTHAPRLALSPSGTSVGAAATPTPVTGKRSITGTVHAAGQPVEGVKLSWRQLSQERAVLATCGNARGRRPSPCTTDGHGRFSFVCDAGTWEVHAIHPDGTRSLPTVADVLFDTTAEIEVRFGTIRVDLWAVDAGNGAAIAGAFLGTDRGPSNRAGQDGRFFLEHQRPGTRLLRFDHEDYHARLVRVQISESRAPVIIELEPRTRLRGQVFGTDGALLPLGTVVVLRDERFDALAPDEQARRRRVVSTTVRGEAQGYVFEDIEPSLYSVLVARHRPGVSRDRKVAEAVWVAIAELFPGTTELELWPPFAP